MALRRSRRRAVVEAAPMRIPKIILQEQGVCKSISVTWGCVCVAVSANCVSDKRRVSVWGGGGFAKHVHTQQNDKSQESQGISIYICMYLYIYVCTSICGTIACCGGSRCCRVLLRLFLYMLLALQNESPMSTLNLLTIHVAYTQPHTHTYI